MQPMRATATVFADTVKAISAGSNFLTDLTRNGIKANRMDEPDPPGGSSYRKRSEGRMKR
jgi:hypothetical protein